MRLPTTVNDLTTMLAEFDVWLTPSLGELQQTDRFRCAMDDTVSVFEAIGAATENFLSPEQCRPEAIAEAFLTMITGKAVAGATHLLQSVASVLFLVTAKSDNNAKCQFPIHLRDQGWDTFPQVQRRQGRYVVTTRQLPRTLKSDDYMALVAKLGADNAGQQRRLLTEFVRFVLNQEAYIDQLWSIGRSYYFLKDLDKERSLLTPLVVFQIRGSVTASGGHDPEELLRERLAEWGLSRDVDYNLYDVTIQDNGETEQETEQGADQETEEEADQDAEEEAEEEKERKYDFVLPFRTEGWAQEVFVQCQFYAGDSGSVSHKNIGQTTASRRKVLESNPEARFVEYVDGAGYFSTLNTDLRKLLSMTTTASFFQVRSAPIRLRYELQRIGFLTTLELEHAIMRTDGSTAAVADLLAQEGYSAEEIRRCKEYSTHNGLVAHGEGGRLRVLDERRELVRRYFLLDTVACNGTRLDRAPGTLEGHVLVPGYGPFFGMRLDEIIPQALAAAPALGDDWGDPTVVASDIAWLSSSTYAMLR